MNELKLYVSTGAFIGRVNGRNPRPFLSIAPTLVCDGFELMLYEAWYEKLSEILDLFLSSSLSFPVLHVEKGVGEIIGAGEANFARRASERFEINCRAAKTVGAEKLVFHLWNGIPSDRAFDRHLDACGEFLAIADSYGLSLTVENVVAVSASPLAHLLSLAERYPALKFTFDTKMASFHRETEAIFRPEYAPLRAAISHLHINDHKGEYMDFSSLRTLHIGEGIIDFDRFFRGLSEMAYQNSMTLECTSMCADGSLAPEKMNMSIERVRQLTRLYITKEERTNEHGK